MKKYMTLILSVCLVLSLCGNLYLYNLQQQAAGQIVALNSEIAQNAEGTANFERDAATAKQEAAQMLAKQTELQRELEELKQQVEEQKKAAEIDNSVVSRPDVPKDDDGAPDAEENPNAPSSTPESKPSTGGIRTSGTVPGATQKDKYLGLKDGEAMTPAGKFIPRSDAYDMCYYNEGGTIYKILRGVSKEVGSPIGGQMEGNGPTGETWG